MAREELQIIGFNLILLEENSMWNKIFLILACVNYVGPNLFLLYINDICNISLDIKCILYADYTSILC